MKIFWTQAVKFVVIISLFLLFEFLGKVCFHVKHGYSFKESFLYKNDETLIYKINPDYKGKHGTYHLGIRKDYFEKDKKGKFRIICIGGSTTFGHNQPDNSKVWPEVLERLLNKEVKKKRYEVLNAGVSGYGSSNLAARLKKETLGLKPDVIIIFEGWNLVGSVKSRYAWVPDNIYFKKQPFVKKINNFLIDNSILYIKLTNLVTTKFLAAKTNEMKENIVDKTYKSLLPVFRKDMEEMISICNNNNIIPILIKYPTRDYDYARYKDTIAVIESVALETNTCLIDCAFYFKGLDDRGRAEYFTDIAHFSDKGNEKIAEIIYLALLIQTH